MHSRLWRKRCVSWLAGASLWQTLIITAVWNYFGLMGEKSNSWAQFMQSSVLTPSSTVRKFNSMNLIKHLHKHHRKEYVNFWKSWPYRATLTCCSFITFTALSWAEPVLKTCSGVEPNRARDHGYISPLQPTCNKPLSPPQTDTQLTSGNMREDSVRGSQ